MSICVGVGNKARKVKRLYVGVNGKARKIKKAYIGVNGKARLCYKSGFGDSPEGLYVFQCGKSREDTTARLLSISCTDGTFSVTKEIPISCVSVSFYKNDNTFIPNKLGFAGTAGKLCISEYGDGAHVVDSKTGASIGTSVFEINFGSDEFLGSYSVDSSARDYRFRKMDPETYVQLSSVKLADRKWGNYDLNIKIPSYFGGKSNILYAPSEYSISSTFYVLTWFNVDTGAFIGCQHAADSMNGTRLNGPSADALGSWVYGATDSHYNGGYPTLYRFDGNTKAEAGYSKLNANYCAAMCTVK